PASSATDSVPVRAPKAVGVKVKLVGELAWAAETGGLVRQALAPVLVAAESPEAAKEVIVKAAVPVLVSVAVTDALVVMSGWLPKPRLVGANPTAAAVPSLSLPAALPISPASSATDSVPVRAPEVVGVKV